MTLTMSICNLQRKFCLFKNFKLKRIDSFSADVRNHMLIIPCKNPFKSINQSRKYKPSLSLGG